MDNDLDRARGPSSLPLVIRASLAVHCGFEVLSRALLAYSPVLIAYMLGSPHVQ